MRVLRKQHMFAVIVMMIALASLTQLGSMHKDFLSGVNIQEWVQGLSWTKQTDACTTNCGAEVTEEESITFKPERIIVESIKMDKKVISVPLQNGTWAVHHGVANYAEGTSLINNKDGNVGLFGHSQANAFLPIKDIQLGETIAVYGEGYKATYKVSKTDIVKPDNVEVFYPTEKPSVTLITCDGPQDIHRYMVRAELVKIERTK